MVDANYAARNGDVLTLLEYFRVDILNRLKCHDVGVIQSFDVVNQTATISMAYKPQTAYQNEVNQKVQDSAILIQCPIMVASGGKARLTFPITKGDQCLVCYNDKDLQNWFAYGVDNLLLTDSQHSYSDAIAIVGLFPLNKSLANYSADRAEFSYEDTKISIKDKIKIENAQYKLTTGLKLMAECLNLLATTAITGNIVSLPPAGTPNVPVVISPSPLLASKAADITALVTGINNLMET